MYKSRIRHVYTSCHFTVRCGYFGIEMDHEKDIIMCYTVDNSHLKYLGECLGFHCSFFAVHVRITCA